MFGGSVGPEKSRRVHTFVSVLASTVGTDDAEAYPVTVAGLWSGDGPVGRSSRTFTYAGELVEMVRRRRDLTETRLRSRC